MSFLKWWITRGDRVIADVLRKPHPHIEAESNYLLCFQLDLKLPAIVARTVSVVT
ncbi:hypothetical protein [Roseiconus nitratireducens]|uniref:hypothetical protein n=1 Tax=Roseiconus nitratireducens TaxID=2605748 RepID=UPI001375E430|nr:hypothetical protein [Roseiconus nitratireducens]